MSAAEPKLPLRLAQFPTGDGSELASKRVIDLQRGGLLRAAEDEAARWTIL
jgi:hypothetical protein